MMPEAAYTRPATFHDLVCRLIDFGYYPVPIPEGCKGPTIQGWQHLEMTKDQVPQYFDKPNMLVGVLHKNTCFIDIDVYDAELAATISEEGHRRFPGALERVGQYPKTALVLRMDGAGFKVGNTIKAEAEVDGKTITAQVEIRTLTRQAVVYGIHPDTGETYKWINGPELWATPLADLPTADKDAVQDFRDWCDDQIRDWAGIAEQQTAQVFHIGMFHTNSDDKATEEQFQAALNHVPADVDYDTWLHCLMGIHDYYGGSPIGLAAAQAWSANYHAYDPREVETKWRSFEVGKGVGYKTVFAIAKQNGADLSEIARMGKPALPAVSGTLNVPSPVQVTQPQTDGQTTPQVIVDFKIDSSADFLSDLEPLEYLIDGILPRGVAYSLTGHAGHGKTTLALQFALCVATGSMFSDRDTSKGSVLFLAGENPYNVKWQYAAALAARDMKPEEADIHFVQGRFSITQWTDILRAKMEAMPSLKLVIVDSLQAFFEGDNDNDNSQMVEMAHRMRNLCATSQRPALLIIAHPAGKTPSKDNLVPRGGGAFLNEIDGNLTVWSQDASQQTLHHSQKFRGPGFDPMEWVMQVHEFDHLTDIHSTPLKLPVSRPETTIERANREVQTDDFLRQYLDAVEQGKAPSEREGAERFRISRHRMRCIIQTAKDEKLIKRYAKTYKITDGGREFLEEKSNGM